MFWINLPLAWIQSLTLDFLQSAWLVFSQWCQVLFPRNQKFLAYKRCLDYTTKYSRWLTQFYKPKLNMIGFEEPIQNTHKSHTFFITKMYFYIWNNLDVRSTKRVISGTDLSIPTKIELIKNLKLLKIEFKWRLLTHLCFKFLVWKILNLH